MFLGRSFLFSLPAPSPLPLTGFISSSLREVSTWRFREQIAPSKKTPALQANLFTVFSTFDMDKLGKICQHHWKEHLKISKIAVFESDTCKACRDSSASCEKFTEICIVGGKFGPPTIQISVKFCNLEELYLH